MEENLRKKDFQIEFSAESVRIGDLVCYDKDVSSGKKASVLGIVLQISKSPWENGISNKKCFFLRLLTANGIENQMIFQGQVIHSINTEHKNYDHQRYAA